MKQIAVYLLMLLSAQLSAQNQADTFKVAKAEPFVFVEQPPEFPGGEAGLLNFIRRTVVYPPNEILNKVEGKVLLTFVVNEDGAVSDVTVIRGVSPALNKEAVRVVSALPNFKPGRNRGKPVKVSYNLPIEFRLNGDTK